MRPAEVTALLERWSAGDRAALDELMPIVWGELRRIARRRLARERAGHTLQTTALVNEAYLRLVDQDRVRWQNRAHFFGVAARMMRRILVDHARARAASKRGSGVVAVPLEQARPPAPVSGVDVLGLDAALLRLSALDPRQGQVVELRFFGGLTVEEVAEVLGIAPITVKRDWRMARAWLFAELAGGKQ